MPAIKESACNRRSSGFLSLSTASHQPARSQWVRAGAARSLGALLRRRGIRRRLVVRRDLRFSRTSLVDFAIDRINRTNGAVGLTIVLEGTIEASGLFVVADRRATTSSVTRGGPARELRLPERTRFDRPAAGTTVSDAGLQDLRRR
jgi:hypothetical protein